MPSGLSEQVVPHLPFSKRLLQQAGEGDEVLYAETFRAQVKYGVGKERGSLPVVPHFAGGPGGDNGAQRVAHSLAPLVESRLDHCLEKAFIASEVCPGVADQPYYG